MSASKNKPVTKTGGKLTAMREAFREYTEAARGVENKGQAFILSVFRAIRSGLILTGADMDVVGLVGGAKSPTGPRRSRIIGKSGVVALIAEADTAGTLPVTKSGKPSTVLPAPVLVALATYWDKGTTDSYTAVREALSLPVAPRKARPEGNGKGKGKQADKGKQAAQPVAVKSMTPRQLTDMIVRAFGQLQSVGTTVSQEADLNRAIDSWRAEVATRTA